MICEILHNLGQIWGSYFKAQNLTNKTTELYYQGKKKPYQKLFIKPIFHSSGHCIE